MATRTRSPEPDVELPAPDELERLRLSPEVAWYLVSRGIPLPDCPPRFKTPEPREVPGARFDPARVDRVLASFRQLRHTQGKWAGKPLVPDPWQVGHILAPVFGWVRFDEEADGWVRVVNELYAEMARKNGKTTLLGGIEVYMACADGEEGAQVITGASTKDQAGFVFNPIKQLAEQSPALKQHVKTTQSKIIHKRTGSYIQVISAVADAQHGANIHCGGLDELHVYKSPDLVEAIDTGTGSRTQPLIVIITTADDGRQGTIYDRKRTRVEQLASRVLTDPSVYGVVWCADEDDQYGDRPFLEETWKKANPGLGVSPTLAYMRRAAQKAKDSPAELASFLRLHCGIRTKQETRYLELAAWDRNAGLVDAHQLAGRAAYGGLDLAATSDLTAFCLDFPDGVGGHDLLWWHWIPEVAFEKLNRRTHGQAEVWRREGWLTVTDGDVMDYDFTKAVIDETRERFDVREIGYDRWNSSQLVNDLVADGAEMVGVGQGYASMSGPTKEIQRILLEGTPEAPRYRHGGNPLVRWQVDNLAVAMDPAGNVKPAKDRAGDKIDGLVAGIIALSRSMLHQPPKQSAYEDHGLEVI